ncbi:MULTISPECIES: 23S rRNA (guanosine(2251)-2'-O)-methyltransferase RlmB [Exiguobacterium]|uniref:23S rRNA (guanosine(2251)-2'-O)-methyltransferase RlmB n=1 Tax=Exiguobacterium TaxID=33986 RepID=UPI001BEC9225|nr:MULTISPECIES: 23S rRNA (guanosine(2251)-2'-O)-methyltransferase RlmB [Exiguobacterium]MCT4784571.1 23S rRNA (guanosine(2251)-2'-O)-methyltransferase RlmB [Exiguobacterium himgiriensis]
MEEGIDFLYGRNPVMEALRSGRDMNKVFIMEGQQKGPLAQIISMANEASVQVSFVPKTKLEKMAGSEHHQGVVAAVAAYEYKSIDDMFALAESKGETPLFILLDELEDPHNLGSILRTADAVGAHGIIIPKRRSVGLTQTVAKASTGAIEYIPVARVTNLTRTLEELKEKGLWVVGTDASESQDYRRLDGDMPLVVVIGSEGKGMSRLVRETCDFLVHMPMVGHVTSLNASVAAALLLYEVHRTRHPLS